MVVFTIPGKPFGKQRARSTSRGRMYTPAQTVKHEANIKTVAMRHFPAPIEGAVRVTVLATFAPPKSWTKAKTADLLNTFHTAKPDGDNVIKAILDGMNGVAYRDDSQVSEQIVRKVWGPVAQTVVFVEKMT